MARTLGYGDAVRLLGGDPPALIALDRALGGALALATGGVSDIVLSIVDAQGRVIRLGRDLAIGLREQVRGARRVDRTQRLEAAHAVLTVTAYFEALAAAPLPFEASALKLTRREQLRLASGSEPAQGFLDALLNTAPPRPEPHLPYEDFLEQLKNWYGRLSTRLLSFVRGLAVWDELSETAQAATAEVICGVVCDQAVTCFAELYGQMAREVPEFGFWSGQAEHQATRAQIRRALASVEGLFASMSSGAPPVDVAAALSNTYQSALSRPILAEGDAPAGMRLPTLAEGYLDPDFRVRPVGGGDWPADEEWWSEAPARSDLTEYLAGALTAPESRSAPLVILGQPGAGKSVLTKVLAARLPAADFLPVRVVLREAPAEADIQDQIEYAIRAATGERADWPQLARAAGAAMPVVLLDGFDEMLQATGVSHSDYLIKVARFQEREADQGRAVAVLVTTRTAVAGSARYPEGAVALRLEPFTPDQTGSWLGQWNQLNEGYLAAHGLAPLSPTVVARHPALACQPLLLMMLALYDADANALQRGPAAADGQPLDETALYEGLLTAFAAREVGKSAGSLPTAEVARLVEREMQRLSLIALGALNRSRQWITEAELDADLAALLEPAPTKATDFAAPLGQAETALGRFFFIQRAQAVRGGERLQAYEFLHATFGEYLAARLTVQLTAGLLEHRDPLAVGPSVIHDDLLYALLSFAPLSSRQVLRFVQGRCAHQITLQDRHKLAHVLVKVLDDSAFRTEHRHAGYRPARLAISARHGIYSANLVLLITALSEQITASELFPSSADPGRTWNRRALLWRSALNEPGWTELALAFTLRHTWNGPDRDLEISLSGEEHPGLPEPVDGYWLYRYPPGHESRGHIRWYRSYWEEVAHKMDVAGGTNDSVIRHAVEPWFNWLGPAITSFSGIREGRATSVAHDLLNAWLCSTLSGSADLGHIYQRLMVHADGLPPWHQETHRHIQALILTCLHADAARLPADMVAKLLGKFTQVDGSNGQLILETALAAFAADISSEQRSKLVAIAIKAANAQPADPIARLRAWIAVHNAGMDHSDVFPGSPGKFLAEIPFSSVTENYPLLVRQAEIIAATRYGITIAP